MKTPVIRQIDLNGTTITYELWRKPVKNLNVRVRTDQTVYVSANRAVPLTDIERFLRLKADFILGAQNTFAGRKQNAPLPHRYENGETIQILGKERELAVVKGSRNEAVSDGSRVVLTVSSPSDFALKERTMNKWFTLQCRDIITSVCEAVYPEFQKRGISYPQIRLRRMVSRWGSCQPQKKVLTFNTALVKAPPECIEYVVVHEFTHFLVPNHSRQFYDEMAGILPDWKERKKLLEKGNYIDRPYGR